MKIASWNVNSIRARLDHLRTWLSTNQVDILALQETKVQDADFPVTEISEMGYNCLFKGQKSYNGVAILSKIKTIDNSKRQSFQMATLRILCFWNIAI